MILSAQTPGSVWVGFQVGLKGAHGLGIVSELIAEHADREGRRKLRLEPLERLDVAQLCQASGRVAPLGRDVGVLEQQPVVDPPFVQTGPKRVLLRQTGELGPSHSEQHRPLGVVQHEPALVYPTAQERLLQKIASELAELGIRAARGFPPIERPAKQASLRRAKPQKCQVPVLLARYPRAVAQLEELIHDRGCTLRTFPHAVAPERFAHRPDLEREGLAFGRIGKRGFGSKSALFFSAVDLGDRYFHGWHGARYRERGAQKRDRHGKGKQRPPLEVTAQIVWRLNSHAVLLA